MRLGLERDHQTQAKDFQSILTGVTHFSGEHKLQFCSALTFALPLAVVMSKEIPGCLAALQYVH